MESIINTIPGYRVYEYLLVLSPHEELWNRIMKVKEGFADKYKSDYAKWSKPYVTLARFTQHAMMEERIINRLRNVALGFSPFKVELRDFGSFPSHTIYINVVSKLPVQNLVKNIRTETQRLMKLDNDHKPHFIMEPHLTVTRKLQPWQYEKGWLEFSNSYFTGRFIAGEMTLLKRLVVKSTENQGIKYHVATNFKFEKMPVVTKRGELFE